MAMAPPQWTSEHTKPRLLIIVDGATDEATDTDGKTSLREALALAADGGRNGGTWAFNVEHPWSDGGSFPIFAMSEDVNAAPELRGIVPVKCGPSQYDLPITYDLLTAATDAVDPTGQAIRFRITSNDIGQLWRDGVQINLSDPGQSVTWKRPASTSGTLGAFDLKLVGADGTESATSVTVPIRIGSPAGLCAVDDVELLQQNSVDAVVAVLANDQGTGLRVLRVGTPVHGQVNLDAATGQVRYTPAPALSCAPQA